MGVFIQYVGFLWCLQNYSRIEVSSINSSFSRYTLGYQTQQNVHDSNSKALTGVERLRERRMVRSVA